MPIRIDKDDGSFEGIALLCDGDWELPSQLYALESWLTDNAASLPDCGAIADIGFSMRPDASGGGGVLSAEAMRRFADAGVSIWFSEYPPSV
ncbi:hypothetical protein WKV53_05530 [Luteolibacter sp. Y139]|uniref:Uncharacterized protein n=1 Tax=Luteolibacter soli TaxID=3135280 RepID=A0ABU9AT14_9BACT